MDKKNTSKSVLSDVQDPESDIFPLEKLIFLRYLYPKALLEVIEAENVILFTEEGVKIALEGSSEVSRKITQDLWKLESRIKFRLFLLGYSQGLSNSFCYTKRVQTILKYTNSHIITDEKYKLFKFSLTEKYPELKKVQEKELKILGGQPFSILITMSNSDETIEKSPELKKGKEKESKILDEVLLLNSDENIKKDSELKNGKGKEVQILEDQPLSSYAGNIDKIQEILLNRKATSNGCGIWNHGSIPKYKKEVILEYKFEEEPPINEAVLRDVSAKYENKVSILPKIDLYKGQYRLFFGLTTFTGEFLLNAVEKDIREQFIHKEKVEMNHFEFTYYKRILYPSLRELELASNIEVRFEEFKYEWWNMHNQNYIIANLTIQGQRSKVNEFYQEVKKALDNLYIKKIEAPLYVNKEIYYEFKESMIDWIYKVSQDFEGVVFSNHTLLEYKRNEDSDYQPKNQPKAAIVLFAIGDKGSKDQIARAAQQVSDIISSLKFWYCSKDFAQLKKIAQEVVYLNVGELEEGLEVLLKDSFKKGKGYEPTIVYGRQEDYEFFNTFIESYRYVYDINNLTYMRILQRKDDGFLARALQLQIPLKFHPYLPKINLAGTVELVKIFREYISDRIKDFKSETAYYDISKSLAVWMTKPISNHILTWLEQKHKVFFIPPSDIDRRPDFKLGVIGSKGLHEAAIKDMKLYAFGKEVEIEIKATPNYSIDYLAEKALKEELKVEREEGKITLKGEHKRILDFKETFLREDVKEIKHLYPKYWDFSEAKSQVTKFDLEKTNQEFKSTSYLFLRSMDKASILKIERIQNHYLYDKFLKASQVKDAGTKMLLFYGSKWVDPAQIYDDFEIGFDPYSSNSDGKQKKETLFFTLDAKEAHENYAYQCSKDIYKMIIANVIVEKTELKLLKPNNENQGYEINNSSRCYPLYIITYRTEIQPKYLSLNQ